MDENNPLIPVSMSIIMSAGNARTKANEALDSIASFDFVIAKQKLYRQKQQGNIMNPVYYLHTLKIL